MPSLEIETLIARFGMSALPEEGGWFVRTWTGPDFTTEDGRIRPAGTSILFLIAGEEFSALHRLRGVELWHFHAGSAVELLLLDPVNPNAARRVRLGPAPLAGDAPQTVVPAGWWQGARVVDPNAWALLGCTMTPGWHDDDFELGEREALRELHPNYATDIESLTRVAEEPEPEPIPAQGE